MPLGPAIRRLFGPAEPAVTRLYRSAFTNLPSIASSLADWTAATRILEVGCGEGQLTEELARVFPRAEITGIDITPRVGRLYRGDAGRATFLHCTIRDFTTAHRGAFDLVIIADVLHHMPWAEHDSFLRDAASSLIPGGRLAVKDWERRANVAHLLGYVSDRVITNDRVRYATAAELRATITRALPGATIENEVRLRPWKNNVLFRVRV
jgi:2-polyprenyl-6-hydroxyphenyl methylase/3-demethylubiquinone-9 3-methyltransferase